MSDLCRTIQAIRHCARCDGDHYNLQFMPLARPIRHWWRVWTHWHPCPNNGEPILLRRGGS